MDAQNSKAPKGKIIIGEIALSFHKASAGVFHNVLESLGYQVEMVSAPHEQMFKMQDSGEVDLLISAWLPGSHQKYLDPYKDKTTKLTPIYEPYCIWLVPDYVPEHMVNKVEDLLNAEVAKKMDKDVNGINMGAGISRFSVEIIDQYGLQDLGYKFISNDPKVFLDIVEKKLNDKKWFVIPLWHPQYLNHMFKLRPLIEKKGLLRGKDAATPILLNASKSKLSKEDFGIISVITLGNDVVTQIDYTINKENKTPREAAKAWITEKYGSVDSYIKVLIKTKTNILFN